MANFQDTAYDIAVSPTFDDNNDFAREAVGFIILAAGAIKIKTHAGNAVTIPTGLATGVVHPIRLKRIFATGSTVTAANTILLYAKQQT